MKAGELEAQTAVRNNILSPFLPQKLKEILE